MSYEKLFDALYITPGLLAAVDQAEAFLARAEGAALQCRKQRRRA